MPTYKVKLTEKRVLLLAFAVLCLVAAIALIQRMQPTVTAYTYNYKGVEVVFRANPVEALNVSVYPSDKALLEAVMNASVKKIYVAFVDSKDNNLVAVNGFEVSNKLAIVFRLSGVQKTIKGLPVSSYNLTGTSSTLFIALIPPALANTTGVWLEDNAIFISGKTNKDFDLATVRFLMSIMEVVV
jgi:hypothetical protein